MSIFGAGWASGHIVVADHVKRRADVVEDSKFSPSCLPPHLRFSVPFRLRKLSGHRLPGNQACQVLIGYLGKRVEVGHLGLKIRISTAKPEALTCAAVDAQRSTNGIAIPAGLQGIVLGEDLDSFSLPASLDRDTQPQSKVAHIDAAVARQEWLRHEDPEMPTTIALLKRRIHTILLEAEAKPDEVSQGIRVIGVDG